MGLASNTALPVAADVGAGHVLGRYELLVPIGAGGMAMVWAARLKGTRGFQKIFAIKTMLPKLTDDADFEQMFLDEAGLASQIRHPHVVEILDLGEHDGVLYLVMEWLDGVSLSQLAKAARKQGGVPLPIAVRMVMQACAGLHSAHELRDGTGQLVGLVHRDVSLQNVLVSYDGVTKVVDFGIAKATALGGGKTAAGQLKGKVSYMAPEQARGEPIDRRVDVFAMGVILYALTTGRHPFRSDSEASTIQKICAPQPVMPPRKLIPGYPSELERVVQQALAKDPSKRFATANDLLRALDLSLPASMRVSVDDEVGSFVRGLFGDKREESRIALLSALEAADSSEHSRGSLRAVLDSPVIRELPLSAVSSVTDPSRASVPSLDGLPAEQTGPTLVPMSETRRKRRAPWAKLALVGLALGAVAGGGWLIWGRDSSSPDAKAVAGAEAAKPLAPLPAVREPPPAAPRATASGGGAAPIAREASPVATPRSSPGRSPPRPRASSGAPPKPKPAGAWEHDPGF